MSITFNLKNKREWAMDDMKTIERGQKWFGAIYIKEWSPLVAH